LTTPIGAWTVRALVVYLALGMAWQASAGARGAVADGVKLLDRSQLRPGQQTKNQYDFVRLQLAERVRPGTRAVQGTVPGPTQGWEQRFIEFAIMAGAVVVATPAQADIMISIVADPAAGIGIRVVIERLR
jgi:hypothetical protein